jgi:hypothetical protein
VGPRAGLDEMEKKNSYPCRESKPGRQTRNPSLSRLLPNKIIDNIIFLNILIFMFSGVANAHS